MFGEEKIEGLEQKLETLKARLETLRASARGWAIYGHRQSEKIAPHFKTLLSQNERKLRREVDAFAHEQSASWRDASWDRWRPEIWVPGDGEADDLPSLIRMGDLSAKDGSTAVRLPVFAPFIGKGHCIIVESDGGSYDRGLGLLQSLLVRSAVVLPHQTSYTLLDPSGNGAAFPMRRHLPSVEDSSGDVRRDLDRLIRHIQRINETYLDASTPSFDRVQPTVRVNERFHLVFAANFPHRYDRRAIEALQSVATTGPRTGTYVVLHHNTEHDLPRDLDLDGFSNAVTYEVGSSVTVQGWAFRPDPAPSPDQQKQLFSALSAAKPPERKVDWQTLDPAPAWWQESAAHRIEAPVGIQGATGDLSLWFGTDDNGRPCAHGMIGAMTGSGKSNLYHVLILSLCVRYSPRDLRLFLIDGKDGVEFQPYRDLPHVEVVSLKSTPELSRSVLAELIDEFERRNDVFARVGVTHLADYHHAGQPEGPLPRLLLLIDEYQELFEDDREGEASRLLLQLAQQGRSAGIHMFLGSQHFGAAGMLHRAAIFGNIHLRMAMQMTSADVQSLTEFGRRGKDLIRQCDLPGKVVVNDRSGDDSSNVMGKVAFLESDERSRIIDTLIECAKRALDAGALQPRDVPNTTVFDGKAQPNLVENPHVEVLVRSSHWPTTESLEEVARRPVYEGGFDVPDWFAAQHPAISWLGQDFSVRGEAAFVLRREVSQNAMLIGNADAERYAMLGSILTSIALNAPPPRTIFCTVDRSIPGTEWHAVLEQVHGDVLDRAGFDHTFLRETGAAADLVAGLSSDLDRREALPEKELTREPTVIVLLSDLDRADAFRRRRDAYGTSASESGEHLQRLVHAGPSLGIHVICSFQGVRPMTHVIDERRGLPYFRHRVALQMSEDESFTFIRKRDASQLQETGALPICALYVDVDRSDQILRFKPYSITSTPSFSEQVSDIGTRLASRRKAPA